MGEIKYNLPVYLYSPEEDVSKRKAVCCTTNEQVKHYATLGWIFTQDGPLPAIPEPEPVSEPPDMAVPENIPIRHPEPINHKQGPGRPRKDRDE